MNAHGTKYHRVDRAAGTTLVKIGDDRYAGGLGAGFNEPSIAANEPSSLEDIGLREAALEFGFLTVEQFDLCAHPRDMTHPLGEGL